MPFVGELSDDEIINPYIDHASRVGARTTNGIGTLVEVGVQGLGLHEAERGSHGPPLSFMYISCAQD